MAEWQPAAWIAALHEQQVARAKPVEMLEEHLTPILVDAMQRGGQHQFSAGQDQAEGDLLGAGGVGQSAGAQAAAQGRSLGRNQAQFMPARHEPGVIGASDQIDGSAMFLLVVRLSPVDWILPPPHVCRAGLMAYSAATCIPCIGLCIFCTAKEIGLQE